MRRKPGAKEAADHDRTVALLTNTILGAAAFALFLPLAVNSSFYLSSVFLKSVLFRATVELMVLVYVVLAVRAPEYRPRIRLLSAALIAWFAVMLLCSLPGISIDPWSSWWGDFKRMDGMIAQLHLLAYFFVLAHAVKREAEWVSLFASALFAGALMGFSGLVGDLRLDYLFRLPPETRTQGATGNPDFFAAHLLFDFFIALWFLRHRDQPRIFPVAARFWLILLISLDLFAIGWDLVAGPLFLPGLSIPAVAVIALALHAAALAWFFMRRSVRAGQILLGILCAWYLFWAYRSQTRGALFGLVGASVIMALLYLWRGTGRKARRACAGLVALLVLAPAALVLIRHSTWVKSHPGLLRYASINPAEFTSEARYFAWRAGALGILDRPWLGWGLENYRSAFDLHFPQEFYATLGPDAWFDRAHNLVLDVGTTTGLAGLAVHLGFFGLVLASLIRQWYRTRSTADTLMLTGLLTSYLLHRFFTFDTINTDVMLYLVLAYVAFLQAEARTAPAGGPAKGPASRGAQPPAWPAAVAAGILLVPCAWYSVIRPFESDLVLQRARTSTRVRDPRTRAAKTIFNQDALNLFQRANAFGGTGRHDTHESLAEYASELAQAPDVPPVQKVRVIEQAVGFLRESIAQSPADALHYQYLSTLVTGTFDLVRRVDAKLAQSQAETLLPLLRKAVTLSPTRPQLHFDLSLVCSFLGREDEKLAAWVRGASLCPTVKDPQIELVTLYISNGRFEDAAMEWQRIKGNGFGLTREDYDRVISAYNRRQQLAPIARLYEEQLAAAPGDAGLLARLAATYRALGDFDLARKTALRAAELSPEAAAGLKDFLDSLKKENRSK